MAIRKLQAALILGAALGMAGSAQAGSLFLGGNIGESTNKNWGDDVSAAGAGTASIDDKDTSFKIYGGYTANDYVDFRVGYADLGEASAKDKAGLGIAVNVKSTALFADVVGKLKPANNLSLFAKFGVAYAKTELEGQVGAPAFLSRSNDDKEIVFVPGVGISADLTPNFGLVAEYERYLDVGDKDNTQESDIDVLSAGLYFHF